MGGSAAAAAASQAAHSGDSGATAPDFEPLVRDEVLEPGTDGDAGAEADSGGASAAEAEGESHILRALFDGGAVNSVFAHDVVEGSVRALCPRRPGAPAARLTLPGARTRAQTGGNVTLRRRRSAWRSRRPTRWHARGGRSS